MQVIGAAPLYNNREIIPAKISSVPKVAQHRAEVNRQRKNPATMKITTNATIIAQQYIGICKQACFISALKSGELSMYGLAKMAKPKTAAKPAVSIVINIFSNIIAMTAATAVKIRADAIFRPIIKKPQIPPVIAPTTASKTLLTPNPPSQTNSPTKTAANPGAIKTMGLNSAATRSKF